MYDKMTREDEYRILLMLVEAMTSEQILSYVAVMEFFREELNNTVLDIWTQEQS